MESKGESSMAGGREFQSHGAAPEKALSPKVFKFGQRCTDGESGGELESC